MSLQMRDECCKKSSSLDLDRVLRELQDRVSELDDFSRIGPFGILSIGKEPTRKGLGTALSEAHREGDQTLDTETRVPGVVSSFNVSELDWDKFENLETWESIPTPANLFLNSDYDKPKEPVESDDPSNWELPGGTSVMNYVYYATDNADITHRNVDENETCANFAVIINGLTSKCATLEWTKTDLNSK
jgi:hypothetical protein